MLPETDFETDTEALTPAKAHDRWERVTNLQADALRRLESSERNAEYLDRAENNQGDADPPIPGGPLDDAIHLASTPRDEWGSEERAEADEAINFLSRWRADFQQEAGEALLPDEPPRIHKDEIAAMRWGFDADPEDEFP
jgi:hypothetical protein